MHGLSEAGTVVDALVEELSPAVSMSSTEEDMTKRAQIRASFAAILEKARLAAVEGPLREQFLADLRELTDAEQDSKELQVGEAGPPLQPHPRGGRAAVPGRPRSRPRASPR